MSKALDLRKRIRSVYTILEEASLNSKETGKFQSTPYRTLNQEKEVQMYLASKLPIEAQCCETCRISYLTRNLTKKALLFPLGITSMIRLRICFHRSQPSKPRKARMEIRVSVRPNQWIQQQLWPTGKCGRSLGRAAQTLSPMNLSIPPTNFLPRTLKENKI